MAGNRPRYGASTYLHKDVQLCSHVRLTEFRGSERYPNPRMLKPACFPRWQKAQLRRQRCWGAGAPAPPLGSACWTLLRLAPPSHSPGWPQSWALRLRSLMSLPLLQPCSFSVCSEPCIRFTGSDGREVLFFYILLTPAVFFLKRPLCQWKSFCFPPLHSNGVWKLEGSDSTGNISKLLLMTEKTNRFGIVFVMQLYIKQIWNSH